jgi:ATP-dependent Clp protease ATP-binding subunit ClpC
MPKINVYVPDDLLSAVRDAQVPVSAVCQRALERAVRDVSALRATDRAPGEEELPKSSTFARFTPRARTSLTLAADIARAVPHSYVGTEHVLLGVLDEGGNLAIKVLEALDIELADLRAELVASMGPPTERVEGHLPFTVLAKEALEATTKEAIGMLHNYVGCEHVLLGLLATEKGLASEVLRRMGVELVTTRRAVTTSLAGFVHAQQTVQSKPAESFTPTSTTDAEGDVLQRILDRLDAIERRLPD